MIGDDSARTPTRARLRGEFLARRDFLRRAAYGTAALTVAGWLPSGCAGYQDLVRPEEAATLRFFDARQMAIFRAVAKRMIPDEEGWPTVEEARVAELVDEELALWRNEPPLSPVLDDLKLLLSLVEHATLLDGHVSRFTRLAPEAQDDVLASWEASSIEVRRVGFQALKNLVVFTYYDDDRTFAKLSYAGPWHKHTPQAPLIYPIQPRRV